MVFIDKVKKLIQAFLATESDKYITTESGLKIQISDFSYSDRTKASGSWNDKTISAGSWTDKPKSS